MKIRWLIRNRCLEDIGDRVGPDFFFDLEAFLQSVIELRICVKKGSSRERGKGQG